MSFYPIFKQFLLSLSLVLLFSGCQVEQPEQHKPELLCYCGITMVEPIRKITKIIEQEQNCRIKIIKGGSGNLYRILSVNQAGDLYLPGSESYILKGQQEDIVRKTVTVGYNKAALVVAKNNPLNIPTDLAAVANDKFRVVLGNPDSGSIGKETKYMLHN